VPPPSPTQAPEAGLLDTLERPLRDLRLSVTDRCNFRCTYCMPAELFGDRYQFLPRAEILSFEEIERLVGIFAGLGALKLRVTGGEPLLRVDLADLLGRLSKVPGVEDLALTTNATLLPRQAESLRKAGLTRVTVSLDSLDEAVFGQMNGEKLSVERVLQGITAAERAGFGPIKINCVVQKGVNDHTLVDMARHFKGTGHIVRFIEFMDVGTRNAWDLTQVLPAREIVDRIGAELPLEPAVPNYHGEVARRWRYVDGEGEIGVIASVTQPFCGACTRARLTTEGKLVTCLFASDGTDLRTPLRDGSSDDEIRAIIARVWRTRDDRYSEERGDPMANGESGRRRDRIEMYQIGG
jgi:cyclic pyranopterin phosphate synthase